MSEIYTEDEYEDLQLPVVRTRRKRQDKKKKPAKEDHASEAVENLLKANDCHFNWANDFEGVCRETAVKSVFSSLHRYNESGKYPVRRFALCLHAAYTVFLVENDNRRTCDKLLLTAKRILKHSRHPRSKPPPPSMLPTNAFKSPLWKSSEDQFFARCETLCHCHETKNTWLPDEETSCKCDNESISLVDELDEGTLRLWNEDNFSGMYKGAKYVVDSLAATMMFLDRPKSQKSHSIARRIIRGAELSDSDRALIRYVEAVSWKMVGLTNNFVKASGNAVIAAPADLKWYFLLMKALQEAQSNRRHSGHQVEWVDMETCVNVIESVLELNQTPWIVAHLNFEKFKAIEAFLTNGKEPFRERSQLKATCNRIANSMIENNGTHPECLAHCAKFLSRERRTIDVAVSLVEKALSDAVDGQCFINKLACDVFMKAALLDRALACAEIASQEDFSSNWRVLEVKLLLGHKINPNEFFKDVRLKITSPYHTALFHINAFLFYVCRTMDLESAISHVKSLVDLPSHTDLFSDVWCLWSKRRVNIAEAAYNITMYVLNKDHMSDGIAVSASTVETCRSLKRTLLKYYLTQSQLNGKIAPKDYIQSLRDGKRTEAR